MPNLSREALPKAETGNVAETALVTGNSPRATFQHHRELFTKAEGETPRHMASRGFAVASAEQLRERDSKRARHVER